MLADWLTRLSRALFAICMAIFYFKIPHSVEQTVMCALLIYFSGQCHMSYAYI